ncbi:NO signaling/Golgi transport ligand-binding domain-containing protein [Hyaloraphidium curvatum]|nr:NO signaling/Golgi transport ligand-binding domain-containing protein [Hyaloraphidium curvatum]
MSAVTNYLPSLPSRLSVGSTDAKGKRQPILERPVNKTRNAEVSLASFALLLSEMIAYSQKRVTGIQDLEKKLSDFGFRVGIRSLELITWREKGSKRETRILNILYFIHSIVWKSLFGKQADALEKSTEHEDEYMISDNEPVLTKYISVPKEFATLNCGAFIAGIVEGILDAAQFPARVTAHSVPIDGFPLRTTILMKFAPEVLEREKGPER